MHFDVSIPKAINQSFAYKFPAPIMAGTRVAVPFRTSELVGVVIGPAVSLTADVIAKLRPISRIIDQEPAFSPALLRLARWLSEYYIHPLGEVLRAMLPASIERVSGAHYALTEQGRDAMSGETDEGMRLAKLFKDDNHLTLAQFRKREASLLKADPFNFDREEFIRDGFIVFSDGIQCPRQLLVEESTDFGDCASPSTKAPTPSQEQIHVLAKINEMLSEKGAPRPILLHGVTGSGKTEVFLQSIATLLSQGDKQALVMVPEISLTPQLTRIFTARFPGLVAVVHSAMTDPRRWQELEKVRSGRAKILIGPRSAVFAPFRNLKLVIVDEEHDGSYKQASGLRYHGRDVAVLRAHMEGAGIILASATPAMESMLNAERGKYQLLTMKARAGGQPLPTINLVKTPVQSFGEALNLPKDQRSMGSHPVSPEVIRLLAETLQARKQALVIINRRGYANFLFNPEKREAISCQYCSISLTVYDRNRRLRCHYCGYQTTIETISSAHKGQLFLVGIGSEQVTEYLAAQLPLARIAQVDSDTVAKSGALESVLNRFREQELDILVGTQLLAKGHDFPQVTLTIILEIDQALNIPDFRAGERAIQILVQAAGRAGRGEHTGQVVVQSCLESSPLIEAALRHDYQGFAQRELMFRQNMAYPPFGRMISIELSAIKPELVEAYAQALGTKARLILSKSRDPAALQLLGPSKPGIEVIRRRHRRNMILLSAQQSLARQVLRELLAACPAPQGVRVVIDVDPQSLL